MCLEIAEQARIPHASNDKLRVLLSGSAPRPPAGDRLPGGNNLPFLGCYLKLLGFISDLLDPILLLLDPILGLLVHFGPIDFI